MPKPYLLPKNALLNLPAQGGATIAVESGVIWFTAAGVDIVLGRGHSYRLPMSETLLLQAMAESRFSLTRPVRQASWLDNGLVRWLSSRAHRPASSA